MSNANSRGFLVRVVTLVHEVIDSKTEVVQFNK